MKILYFSGSTLPSTYANAVHVMKMSAAFAVLGHAVTLYAKAGKNEQDVFSYYGVAPDFDVVRSPDISFPGLSGLIRTGFTLWRKRKADLIYGRDLWTMAAMAGRETPIAFELHEIPRSLFQRFLLRHILRGPNLKGLVVITEGLKTDLLTFMPDFPLEKILVAPDGADVPKHPVVSAPLEKIENTDFQIGYGGSLYKGKGVELILEIAALSPQTGFHVFGGPETEKEKWCALNPPVNVKFYGHIPHGQLKAHLAACNALIAPYMPAIHIGTGADIARWISPLKLFEYMAVKKPVLCADLPVLREIMQESQNALLADPLKPKMWVAAIEKLKNNPQMRQDLSDRAYSDLEAHYSWDRRAEKILRFLNL
ncbi:MAG: glycosyltransferase family 4 protein [Alphaproteobacteria bacterium]|nr:glycosyltransferase family 4 protein [Alphaproteobacteria bacterium]